MSVVPANGGTPASLDRPAVDMSLLILRAVFGFVFAFHGYPKSSKAGCTRCLRDWDS